MRKLLLLLMLFSFIAIKGQTDRIIDHRCSAFQKIPHNWIDSAKFKLNIFYARASHGSQLTRGGMSALVNFAKEYASLYNFNPTGAGGALTLFEVNEDLEHENSTWLATTEDYLDSHPDCNVVMWAWCDIYGLDVDQYLTDMETLIFNYGTGGARARNNPVTFVFMTAHTWPYNGDGMGKMVYDANQKIRKHCEDNNRWCYDFYDLECWDPDDNYFGDGTPERVYTGENRLRWDCSYDLPGGSRGNWGIEWMQANPDHELTKLAADSICTSCEHSDGEDNDNNSRLQCVLKGNAAWWLWARLAGWDTYDLPMNNEKEMQAFVESPIIRSYTNPVNNILFLQLNETINIQPIVKILDISGRTVMNFRADDSKLEIDLSGYSDGFYILYAISNGPKIECIKIIKQNKN